MGCTPVGSGGKTRSEVSMDRELQELDKSN